MSLEADWPRRAQQAYILILDAEQRTQAKSDLQPRELWAHRHMLLSWGCDDLLQQQWKTNTHSPPVTTDNLLFQDPAWCINVGERKAHVGLKCGIPDPLGKHLSWACVALGQSMEEKGEDKKARR